MIESKFYNDLKTHFALSTGFILSGNINDLVYFPEEHLGFKGMQKLSAFLYAFSAHRDFHVIFFDYVRGFYNRFSPDDLSLFASIIGEKVNPKTNCICAPFTERSNDDSKNAPLAFPQMLEKVMSQNENKFTVILLNAERFTDSNEHLSEEERKSYEIILDSALQPSGNKMIIVTENCNKLPIWINGSRYFKSLRIDSPNFDERFTYIREIFPHFFKQETYDRDIATMSESQIRTQINKLTALTDNKTYMEIEQIRRLSISMDLPVRQLCEAYNLYEYGIRKNPWESERLKENLKNAEEFLSQRIKGQSEAIKTVVTKLRRVALGIDSVLDNPDSTDQRPRAVFFLVGATGVGKTELSHSLGELIFGDAGAVHKENMAEYDSPGSFRRFIGSDPSYIGYGDGNDLVSKIRANPFQILVFDELEKCDRSVVKRAFLSILDKGVLSNSFGTASFKDTVIIMTSNLGVQDSNNNYLIDVSMGYQQIEDSIKSSVKSYFEGISPEMYGRYNGTCTSVFYDFLRDDAVEKIISELLEHSKKGYRQAGIEVSFDRDIVPQLMKLCDYSFGARAVKSTVSTYITNQIGDYIVSCVDREHKPKRLYIKDIVTDDNNAYKTIIEEAIE